MKIDLIDEGTHTRVLLSGTLDEGAKAAFDEQLHPRIAERGCRLLMDLSGVERISSAGIGHLVTLISRANTKGNRVVLVSLTPFVRSVFHATKLTKFFEIEESPEKGLDRLINEKEE